jgi:RNA-directed DNA polymerase
MEAIFERNNLRKALAQVRRNKGAAGVDGMSVEALSAHLKDHWPTIRARLLDGSYEPQPVRRVEIPKPGGGVRPLGVPTVLDRFIQQAALQVLQAHWDGTFSASSYGFRPGRSAHQAVSAAQALIASGRRIVVDLDIEKFFDSIPHSDLLKSVARRIVDRHVLHLIKMWLQAPVEERAPCSPTST